MPDKTSKVIASIKQKVSKLKDEELKQGVLNVDYFWTTRAIISPGIFSFLDMFKYRGNTIITLNTPVPIRSLQLRNFYR